MFAENEKISVQQVESLLFLDWIGKLLLLLPVLCRPLSGWNFLAAVALGIFWMFLYLFFLGKVSGQIRRSFSEYLRERFGKWVSYVIGIIFLIYLFLNQTYLVRMTARICRTFLLPEVSETMLAMLVILAGNAAAKGSGQKRARLARCLAAPVGVALILMLIASVFAVNADNLRPETHMDAWRIVQKSGLVFASFTAVTMVLYEAPYINWNTKKRGNVLRHCAKTTAVFLMLAFLTALGILGQKSLLLLEWPVVTVMGDVNLPGNFLQRWDTVFLAFLLFSLFFASGTCCHYAERVMQELFSKQKNRSVLSAVFAVMTALVFISRSYEQAADWFIRYAVKGAVPLMLMLPVLLWLVECIKQRYETKAENTDTLNGKGK